MRLSLILSLTLLLAALPGAIPAEARSGTIGGIAQDDSPYQPHRTGPGSGFAASGTYSYNGDRVELLEAENGWQKVIGPDGAVGWVPGSMVSADPGRPAAEPRIPMARVAGMGPARNNLLPIRAERSARASRTGELYAGDRVEVLDRRGEWTAIRMGRLQGWVESRFLTAE